MSEATIADVLKKKGEQVVTLDANKTVADAVELMVRHNIGSVLVTNEDGICGIFTERDYLKKVAAAHFDPRKAKVLDGASCNLIAIDPSYTVREAMAIMTEEHCRHLPVVEDGKLVGLVSIGDLVRQVSEDQETHIRYLTDYLTSKYPG